MLFTASWHCTNTNFRWRWPPLAWRWPRWEQERSPPTTCSTVKVGRAPGLPNGRKNRSVSCPVEERWAPAWLEPPRRKPVAALTAARSTKSHTAGFLFRHTTPPAATKRAPASGPCQSNRQAPRTRHPASCRCWSASVFLARRSPWRYSARRSPPVVRRSCSKIWIHPRYSADSCCRPYSASRRQGFAPALSQYTRRRPEKLLPDLSFPGSRTFQNTYRQYTRFSL